MGGCSPGEQTYETCLSDEENPTSTKVLLDVRKSDQKVDQDRHTLR